MIAVGGMEDMVYILYVGLIVVATLTLLAGLLNILTSCRPKLYFLIPSCCLTFVVLTVASLTGGFLIYSYFNSLSYMKSFCSGTIDEARSL
jgi:hypothetical protein